MMNNEVNKEKEYYEEEYHAERFVPKVQCCVCGLIIDSNPSNMCPNCLRAHVDVTDSIQKEYILIYCPECERYLQPPKYWAKAEVESRELLTLCLKRIKGLNNSAGSNNNTSKAKLIDAKFIWTEPHSKRIKVKLTVQKEIFNNIVIQQSCLIEYVVSWQQCPTCQKVSTGQPQWDACVQLRQKVEHKKTFLYLEQLILKKRLHENFIRIENQSDGLDFYFAHKSHAMNFIEFLNKSAPITRRDAVQLVSHDSKNNTAIQHFTFSIDIAPLCREDLILLPYSGYYLKHLGGMGPLVLIHKVYSSIVFLDPATLRAGEITGNLYWKQPFQSLLTSREMSEFYVLECTLLPTTNGVYQLGIVTVCLSDEVGSGREWIVQSHLGALLKPGDLVKGYLLEGRNFNNEEIEEHRYKEEQIADVVLVRKHFPAQRARRSKRLWKLKKLNVVTTQGENTILGRRNEAIGKRNYSYSATNNNTGNDNDDDDEAEFEDEIERDRELRKDIDIYRRQITDPIIRHGELGQLTLQLKSNNNSEVQHQIDNTSANATVDDGAHLDVCNLSGNNNNNNNNINSCNDKSEYNNYSNNPRDNNYYEGDAEEDEEEIPEISLEEMLDELQINDEEDVNSVEYEEQEKKCETNSSSPNAKEEHHHKNIPTVPSEHDDAEEDYLDNITYNKKYRMEEANEQMKQNLR